MRRAIPQLLLGACLPFAALPTTFAVDWTGAVNSDWSNGANWSSTQSPSPTTQATISSANSNPVVIHDGETATASDVYLGAYATETQPVSLQLDGTLETSDLVQAYTSNSESSIRVTGAGYLQALGIMYVANAGKATMTIENGGRVSGYCFLASAASSQGTLQIKGVEGNRGELDTPGLAGGAGIHKVQIDGGRLSSSINTIFTWISDLGATDLTIENGGAYLNIRGNVDSTVPFSGPGTLVKEGSGTLTMSADNTHLGGTQITRGGIKLTSGATLGTGDVEVGNQRYSAVLDVEQGCVLSAPVRILERGRLAGNGTFNDTVEVASGGTISPSLTEGASMMSVANLSLEGGSTVALEMGSISSLLRVPGSWEKTGAGPITLSLVDQGVDEGASYTLATFESQTGLDVSDFVVTGFPAGGQLSFTDHQLLYRTPVTVLVRGRGRGSRLIFDITNTADAERNFVMRASPRPGQRSPLSFRLDGRDVTSRFRLNYAGVGTLQPGQKARLVISPTSDYKKRNLRVRLTLFHLRNRRVAVVTARTKIERRSPR